MHKGQLVFATNNAHKLREARSILPSAIQLLSLNEINCADELPETHDTLEENALEKAEHVFKKYKVNCFAEDTGLEVEALNGAPGVYSARYAGEGKNSRDNISLLLKNMNGIQNRKARFRAVIALMLGASHYSFEGIINGQILSAPTGTGGFGYDPVFVPAGYNESFAQMAEGEKNKISHRKIALDKLAQFLSGA